jgi:hypothetical protein
MKNKKTIWDHLFLVILIGVLILISSCEYEPYEPFEKDRVKQYNKSWDIIKNYPFEVLDYSNLNYYPDCWLDTSTLLADFDLDGDNDIVIAPDCTDDDQRQPPIKFFINEDGQFYESDIVIENNIGTISGTRMSLIGDYNGDLIPDVFFISHNGHGYDFGVPAILLSKGDSFVYKDLDWMEKAWYSEGASGDIDNDGDLDIILSVDNGLLLNDGNANFTLVKDFVDGYPGLGFGVPGLMDFNKDKYLDLVYRDYDTHVIILNDKGKFNYSNSISIPMPLVSKIDLDIKDRLIVDYDLDGDLDIISVSVPHDPSLDGYFNFIQVVENKEGKFIDVSSEVLSKQRFDYYIEWLRAKDLDKDNNLEIFEHQKTNNWFQLEFINNKFILQ